MRKAVFAIAVLGFALALAGCRGITPDLHDTHTITLNPGISLDAITDEYGNAHDYQDRVSFYGGAVNNGRTHTLETDIRGMLASLPNPEWGIWTWTCATHDWPGVCEHHDCEYQVWTFTPEPGGPTFDGWFTGAHTPIHRGTVFHHATMVHARWVTVTENLVPGSVAAQIADLRRLEEVHSPGMPMEFDIYLRFSEYIRPQILDFGGREVAINLRLADNLDPDMYREWNPRLTIHGMGAIFTVRNNVTLTIEGVDIWGNRNYSSLIVVGNGGTVYIRDGVMITHNNVESGRFGGVATVDRGGTLIMEGGWLWQNTFTNPFLGLNTASGGGAVWVRGGVFEMHGGTIEENFALGGGGAVRVSHGGTFTMYDGLIYDNMAAVGAGVMVAGEGDTESRFIMHGGEIYRNFAPFFGTGVAVGLGGLFEMHDGLIWFNEGNDGVGVTNDGTTILRGGNIGLNTSLTNATGGVANWNEFQMWDGLIAYNDGGLGGGVRNLATFQMFYGAILGNIASGPAGGIINIGDFRMFGGHINHNFSSDQGGGISQGDSGNANSGMFQIAGGNLWNNRDQATTNNGIPGWAGNMHRRSPSVESLALIRRGFYSLDSGDHPGAGWTMISGPLPILDGDNLPAWYLTPGSVIPENQAVATAYFFTPPSLAYPLNWEHSFWVPGRPRVESRQVWDDFIGDYVPVLELVFSHDAPAVSNGEPARGGVSFPSNMPTLVFGTTNQVAAWNVTNGVMRRIQTPLVGTPTGPSMYVIGYFNNHPPPAATVWPWVQGPVGAAAGLAYHSPAQWHPPMLPPKVQEHPALEAMRSLRPNLDAIIGQRINDLASRRPAMVAPTAANLLRQRNLELPEQQMLGLVERLENRVEELRQQRPFGQR